MHAVDLLNTIRNLCAGLAITFSDIAWDWMFAYEQNRATSPDTTTMQEYTAEFQSPSMVHALHEHIMLNIARLTFNDLFYFLSMLFATLTCLIWLTQHTPKISGKKLDFTMLETLGEEP
jgi:DHA2 family multidrug resistance protein